MVLPHPLYVPLDRYDSVLFSVHFHISYTFCPWEATSRAADHLSSHRFPEKMMIFCRADTRRIRTVWLITAAVALFVGWAKFSNDCRVSSCRIVPFDGAQSLLAFQHAPYLRQRARCCIRVLVQDRYPSAAYFPTTNHPDRGQRLCRSETLGNCLKDGTN